MSDERFDLIFEGIIAPGADRAEARRRIAAIFKLSEEGADRLFSGKPVMVKRDADNATVEQFKTVFSRSGAVLTIVATGTAASPGASAPSPSAPGEPAADTSNADAAEQSKAAADNPLSRIDTSHLSLAPQGGMLEDPPAPPDRQIDISYLSLVADENWSLEDCEPPPTPVLLPDLSGLSLVPQPPREEKESDID